MEKFIHVSHLNAKENPQKIWRGSEYLRSKEGVTDWSTPGNPALKYLGVSLTPFPPMARFVLHPKRAHTYYYEELGEFVYPEPPKPADFYKTTPARFAEA